MKITNECWLPQPVVDAVTMDPYQVGAGGADISVTRLIQPPRKVALEKLHAEELVEDASDRIWALMGQLGHMVLERSATKDIVERRWFADIGGWRISGQTDIYSRTILLDYKFTSVYTVKDGLKPEWKNQLNLLALLGRLNGFEINKAQIVCIFRDWSVMDAKRDPASPQKQIMMLDVPLMETDAIMAYAKERVKLHQLAQEKELPLCTSEDRWERGAVWAVMKTGRKSAVKLHYNPDDADEMARKLGAGHSVTTRPPTQIRCANYCAAAPFCEQWKKLQPTTQPSAELELTN